MWCTIASLAPGESSTCTATGNAQPGQYENLGTATGTTPAGTEVSDEDPSHYFGVEASIDIEKATNGEDADNPTGPLIPVGDTVTWTYVVTNGSTDTCWRHSDLDLCGNQYRECRAYIH